MRRQPQYFETEFRTHFDFFHMKNNLRPLPARGKSDYYFIYYHRHIIFKTEVFLIFLENPVFLRV